MTSTKQSGFALIPALILAIIGIGLTFAVMMASATSDKLAKTKTLVLQTEYLALGAVEWAKKDIQDAVSAGATAPTAGTATIDGISIPYTITASGSPDVTTDASGFQTVVESYEIVAEARIHGVRYEAHRVVNVRTTPLFQYAVFFEQSLDIIPGPSMTLSGRIHTNGDLRIGCGGTLTFDSNHIRVVGELRRWYKQLDMPTNGDVRIRKWVANPFDSGEPSVFEDVENQSTMSGLGLPATTGYDSRFAGHDDNGDGDYDDSGDWLPFDAGAIDRYGPPTGYPDPGQTLLTGAHGVTEATPPPVDSIAMFEPDSAGDYEWDSGSGKYVSTTPGTGTHSKGFYHETADLTIIVDSDGVTWSAYDAGGFDQTGAVFSAVTMDTTYDERQGGYVPVAKIDLAALKAASAFPANGMIYVGHYGLGTGTAAKGVHLVNGSELDADLTVVSEGSAYIQGDYNTVTPKSASVMCDAVNMLSNSWANGPTMPTASSTTYNTALVVGNMETTDSDYNGGLENLPRFHENWSGVTCTLTGSMNSIWTNQHATGLVSDARYNPPIRDYRYDTRFNSVAALPPFTPQIASVEDVVSW